MNRTEQQETATDRASQAAIDMANIEAVEAQQTVNNWQYEQNLISTPWPTETQF
jgi:hypothetical protein